MLVVGVVGLLERSRDDFIKQCLVAISTTLVRFPVAFFVRFVFCAFRILLVIVWLCFVVAFAFRLSLFSFALALLLCSSSVVRKAKLKNGPQVRLVDDAISIYI